MPSTSAVAADWEAEDSDDEWDSVDLLDGLQEDRSDFAQQADWDDAVADGRWSLEGLQEISSSKLQLQVSLPQSTTTQSCATTPTTPRSNRSGESFGITGGSTWKSNGSETPRRYKWDVKPGGSYVPEAPSAIRNSEVKDVPAQQRKWEVKFAPHVATASRRTSVMISEVQSLMDQYQDVSQLRTAVGGVPISPPRKIAYNSKLTPPQSPETVSPRPPHESSDHGATEAARQQGLQGLQAEFAESSAHGVRRENGLRSSRDDATAEHAQPAHGVTQGLHTSLPSDNLPLASNTSRRPLPEGKSADRIWQAEDFEECYAHDMVDGLLQMLMSSDATLSSKAAAALCNLCADSESNREQVIASGALTRLIEMLQNPSAEVPFMQSAAAACLCNLAANATSKVTIARSGAIEVVVNVLRSTNLAAAAQAAGALWSLCVDNDHNKQLVADAGAIPHLVKLLHSDDMFTVAQAAGALSECSIRNDRNKILISQAGTIPYLVGMLKSEDLNVRRLASCAICNVCANNDNNKRQAREAGALPILVRLLADPGIPAVLTPIAGAVCNLSMKNAENRDELIRLGAIEVLRKLTESNVAALRGNVIAALNQLEGRRH